MHTRDPFGTSLLGRVRCWDSDFQTAEQEVLAQIESKIRGRRQLLAGDSHLPATTS